MVKVILKLEVHDDAAKEEAEKAASSLSGINSVWMYMEEKELTVTGDVDPLDIVQKLRRWSPKLHWVGPANVPEDKKKDVPESTHLVLEL